MLKKPYLPTTENERAVWLANFINKLNNSGYATLFGISGPIMTLLAAFLVYYTGLLTQLENLRQNLKDLGQHKDEFANSPKGSALTAFTPYTVVLPTLPTEGGMWGLVRFLVGGIKKNAAYTNSIGEDLGVIGSDQVFDPITFKPVITSVKIQPGPHIILNFTKDQTDGCNFYSRTNGGDWVKRAYDTNPPYDDYTALQEPGRAEKREYRCRGVIADVEIGVSSEISTITVSE